MFRKSVPSPSEPGPKKGDLVDLSEDEHPPPCKYGKACYRKNPQHHKEYSHPSRRTPCDSYRFLENSSNPTAPDPEHDLGNSIYGFYLYRVAGVDYGSIPTVTLPGMVNL